MDCPKRDSCLSGFSILLGTPVVMVDMKLDSLPLVYETRRVITLSQRLAGAQGKTLRIAVAKPACDEVNAELLKFLGEGIRKPATSTQATAGTLYTPADPRTP